MSAFLHEYTVHAFYRWQGKRLRCHCGEYVQTVSESRIKRIRMGRVKARRGAVLLFCDRFAR